MRRVRSRWLRGHMGEPSRSLASAEQDYLGYGRAGFSAEWPNGAPLALSLVVNFEAAGEMSYVHGDEHGESLLEFQSPVPPGMPDLGADSIHEYESRAGIWRLVRLFDEYHVSATYFATSTSLQTVPEVAQAIRERGDEAACHGVRWEEPWWLSKDQERRRLRSMQSTFTELIGERPLGCYWRFSPSVNTRRLLAEEGFLYDSNAYNDDLPYIQHIGDRRLVVVPYSLTYNDGKFVMPTGQGFGSPTDFADYCKRAIDELCAEGHAGSPKMMSIGLHPRWSGQAGRTSALREVIEHALERRAWVARRVDIARWWLDRYGDG